jgi:hypothetical protein
MMLEHDGVAIVSVALVLMALAVVRPSTGMRIVVLMLLLAAAVLVGVSLGFKDLMNTFG